MENNTYKKLSHFGDMLNNMSNEPNKNNSYSDEQFEEDLKKWLMETKIQNDTFIEYKVNNFIKNYKDDSG